MCFATAPIMPSQQNIPSLFLRMCGVHDASVEGIEEKWEFARPQHRAAYALMLSPSTVLGSPDGTISGGLMESVSEQVLDSGRTEERSDRG